MSPKRGITRERFLSDCARGGNHERSFLGNAGVAAGCELPSDDAIHAFVSLHDMRAEITFHTLEPGTPCRIAGLDVTAIGQRHPGGSFGYSFVRGGKKVVYSTDAEHKENVVEGSYPFVDFFGGADLLIFDAQYTLLDSIDTKENWGHSNNLVGVELAVRAGVKRLCLFHMEHTCEDDILHATLEKTPAYLEIYSDGLCPVEVMMAYDGLQVELD
jgi:ribonuclease BN (tRNA processing enzyme)